MRGFLKNYFRDFSWVAAGMGGAMVVDFLFYILVGRLMTPVEFGYFGVITSLYYIFLRSPFSVIETVSRKIQADGDDSLEIIGKTSLYSGFTVFGFFLLLSGSISSLLSVPQSVVIVFSMVFPVGYLLAAIVGKVQGDKNYDIYGRYEFLSSLTAFSALALVYMGYGAEAATTMFIIEIVAGLIILSRSESLSLGRESFQYFDLLKKSFIYVLAVHIGFSLDLIAVQYFFSGEVTGMYNTVAVLGKGLFFGAVAVNRSVFPKFVTDEADRLRNLLLSQLLVLAGGIFAVISMLAFGEQIIALTFGSSYTGAAVFAPHYMVMISAISSVALLSNYCISTDRPVRAVAMMPIFQILLILFFHGSVLEIIYSTAAAAASTLLLVSLRAGFSRN